MFAITSVIVAWAVAAPPAGADGPPRTTVAELNAMVEAGNYHLIRRQKIGHQIEAAGEVESVGRWPMLKLAGHWRAHLHNVPDGHGLKPGDRVRFRALILDEAYEGLQLWTYSWAKEPAKPKPVDRPAKVATEGASLDGRWLLTMPRGFEYVATLEPAGEAGLYRLRCGATNLQGVYEAKGRQLTLVRADHPHLAGLAWEVRNANTLVLVTQPNQAQVGSDYRGATLGRQK